MNTTKLSTVEKREKRLFDLKETNINESQLVIHFKQYEDAVKRAVDLEF